MAPSQSLAKLSGVIDSIESLANDWDGDGKASKPKKRELDGRSCCRCIAKRRREGMDAVLTVTFHVHAGVIDVKSGDPQRNANGDREDGWSPQEVGAV